ncbi:MAG: ShlB/FhaC/HecB family hemolysin secretion/activation protein [Nitrospinae bacterium]|nr:ShlB/FhaC/HecB family hemolysin secretion/activation protein [Nitrospinota bacterium]MZH13428.1 ShlB/FhaC/HecB family hemolysin secretion/activation protein [Nitrospinota bacterium]
MIGKILNFKGLKFKARMGRITRFAGVCIFLVGIFCSDSAWGQNVPSAAEPQRLDKRFEQPQAPGSVMEPEIPETKSYTPHADLKKIRFILKKIEVKGSTVYSHSAFKRWQQRFIDKKVSLALIYRFAEKITTKYRNDGYLLSRAIVVPQKIKNGVVTIQVVEGYIGNLKIRGPVKGSKIFLKSYGKGLLRSSPLKAKDLERYLLLIDDLPGVAVESVLVPSKDEPGASELVLTLKHKDMDANGGIDNRGSKFNGPIQLRGGVSSNSALGIYDRLGFQGIFTSQPDELLFFNGFGEVPISSEGTKLFISGSISKSEPGSSLKQFEVEGDSNTFTMRVSHPFIRSRGKNLKGYFGFTSRNSETDLLGSNITTDRLRILNMGMAYDFVDRYRGVNLIAVDLFKGINIFDATEPGSGNLSRADGRSDFTKLSGEMLRLQQLWSGWSFLTSLGWQYAFDPLLSSEEFGLGGSQFVRAYDPSEVTGDQGVALKLELQKGIKTDLNYLKSFQAYLYFDHGLVALRNTTAVQDETSSLTSAGLGVRANINEWLNGYLEVGQPLSGDVNAEGDNDPRIFFSLNARY